MGLRGRSESAALTRGEHHGLSKLRTGHEAHLCWERFSERMPPGCDGVGGQGRPRTLAMVPGAARLGALHVADEAE